jgi:predicted nucleic acid-binding protein
MKFFESGPNLEVIPIGRDILLAASRVRAEFRMKLPDAIHVATAMSVGCSTLLTNDRRMKMPADLTLKLWSELR